MENESTTVLHKYSRGRTSRIIAAAGSSQRGKQDSASKSLHAAIALWTVGIFDAYFPFGNGIPWTSS